jgi:hypothetical protein
MNDLFFHKLNRFSCRRFPLPPDFLWFSEEGNSNTSCFFDYALLGRNQATRWAGGLLTGMCRASPAL